MNQRYTHSRKTQNNRSSVKNQSSHTPRGKAVHSKLTDKMNSKISPKISDTRHTAKSKYPKKKTTSNKRKWSEYERGRKPAPASLKKISQVSTGFYIEKKVYSDDD